MLANGTRLLPVSPESERYIKITPVDENGDASSTSITALTVASSDTTVATAAVSSQTGLIRLVLKARGTVTLTVTATNDDAGESATQTFTVQAIGLADIAEVSNGTISETNVWQVNAYSLETATVSIKPAFAEIFAFGNKTLTSGLTGTESDGSYAVQNTVIGDSNDYANIDIVKVGQSAQYALLYMLFDLDDEVAYSLDTVDMKVTTSYGSDYQGGDTIELSLAEWQNNDIIAEFTIHPGLLRDAANVVTTIQSSDPSVVAVKDEEVFVINYSRKLKFTVIGAGAAQLTLNATDGLIYNTTETINITITE